MKAAFLPLALGLTLVACATNAVDYGPIPVAAVTDGQRVDGDTVRHRGFDDSLPAQVGAVDVRVQVSPDLAYVIDNPGDRLGYNGLRDGFGSGGYLGERDVARLVAETREELAEELLRRGVGVDANAATVLEVTLTDLLPNRPTPSQLGAEPGLSFSSFGRGGMSAEGRLLSRDGDVLGSFTYGDYTDFIENASYRGTWTDANRAIRLMAKRVAKRLA